MSSTNNISTPLFPEDEKFDGTNFVGFKSRILIATRVRGAMGYLSGELEKPEDSPLTVDDAATPTSWTSRYPSADEWDARDAWVLALIAYNTKNPIGLGIKLDGTGAEAWESLTETYGDMSEFAAADSERLLRNTPCAEGADFPSHVADLRTKWKNAVEKGASISDKEFRTILLTSLPASWNVLVSTLYACKTSAETITRLNLHWDRLRIQGSTGGTQTTAMQARTSTTKPKLVCTNTPECGRTGHTIENCYWKGGGKEGQFPANFRNRGRTPNTTASTPTTTPAQTTANVVDTAEATYALAAYTEEIYSPEIAALLTKTQIQTFADSGASDHCFVERSMFSDYEEFPTPRLGHAANKGGTFLIKGRGTVKITVKVNEEPVHITFNAALHTPTLTANLISIAKFDAAGFTVTFTSGRAVFTEKGGRALMIGNGANGMYRLDIEHTHTQEGLRALVARSQSTPVSLDVWHRRLGHAGVATIRDMASKELVDGLNIKGGMKVEGVCSDCVYGKHAARPYDGVVVPETQLNHRAHFDIWGPASTASIGGALYMMVGVDGGCSHLSGYCLSRKDADTTLEAFRNYHVTSERQTGHKLKVVRIDAGREWLNQKWSEYCNTHGIILEVNTPYAHPQNGLAERTIRTIIECVRCMLAESGLPKFLWAEACATAIYIRNRIPSSRHPGLIPEEVWTGKRQGVAHLRPFGCTAFAKIPEELVVSKLDPRSVMYVMVGYSSSGYKLFDRGSRSIITSRDVIFDEGTGHRNLLDLGDEDSLATNQPPPVNPALPGILPQNAQPIAPLSRLKSVSDKRAIKSPLSRIDHSKERPYSTSSIPA